MRAVSSLQLGKLILPESFDGPRPELDACVKDRFVYPQPRRALPPPPVTPATGVIDANDKDPMTHLNYYASPALEGRGSPSAGIDKASAYAVDLFKKYGVVGPNPGDSSGNPYYQTFALWGMPQPVNVVELQPCRGPHAMFEHGFFWDESISADDKAAILEQVERSVGKGTAYDALANLPAKTSTHTLGGLAAHFPFEGQVQNVLGLLEGTGPKKDEIVVVMAHLDHLGKRGDRVYFGADDNASGSSLLTSLVARLSEAKAKGQLNRSVLFFLTTAEEKGLVGAKYFVNNAIKGAAMDKIKLVTNWDMVGRWDDTRMSIGLSSKNDSPALKTMVADANGALQKPFERLNYDISSFDSRQDGAAFRKVGKDVLFFFEGLSNPSGGGGENPDYHRTTDTIENMVKENGGNKLRKMTDFAEQMLLRAVNR